MTDRTGRLAGKRVIITGASRGIGRAIAQRYAEEGADLLLTATGIQQLGDTLGDCVSAGAKVLTMAADVSDRAQCEAMVQRAVETFGGLDVLVNNAGIYKAGRFIDYEPETFDRIMQVNTYGTFHAMQFALRHMKANGSGKVVNIASTAGRWESMNQSAYNASKHAVIGMTRCAALEHAKDGITINAICPGFVETDMIDQFDDHAAMAGVSVEELQAALIGRVPIGRMLQPVEIAHLAVYLGCSESDGMTGQAMTISGGMRMG
jgi:meso-butanediol dehydrogenase/(S,S)-butanediol dehydrogenase/diacetyl reductase